MSVYVCIYKYNGKNKPTFKLSETIKNFLGADYIPQTSSCDDSKSDDLCDRIFQYGSRLYRWHAWCSWIENLYNDKRIELNDSALLIGNNKETKIAVQDCILDGNEELAELIVDYANKSDGDYYLCLW